MEIYTIGFGKKTAEQFFGALRGAAVKRLIDVRLNNTSQLAGFTKSDSLPFFLSELCGASYLHELRLAPTKEIFDDYKKRKGSWEDFQRRFLELIRRRDIARVLDKGLFEVPGVLLCSEPTPERCHRRLVVEYLAAEWGDVTAVHL